MNTIIDWDKIKASLNDDIKLEGKMFIIPMSLVEAFYSKLKSEAMKDAIPIEWMKNYARKICTDDDGRYNSKAYGIDRMIYDWEKENEHKESD